MTASSLFEIKELGRGGWIVPVSAIHSRKSQRWEYEYCVAIHDKLHFIGLIILYFSAKYQLWMIDSLMEIILLGHGEMVDLNLIYDSKFPFFIL